MRRWNGWGDESQAMQLPHSAGVFLQETLGDGNKLESASLDEVRTKVPATRLPEHPLIHTDTDTRIRHARGQSLPDWLAMKSGEFEVFPDGVAFPENAEQIQNLLTFANTHNINVIPYGGGTSVAGHITPTASTRAVLTISLARMNQLLSLNTDSQLATFGPGTPGPMVEAQLRAKGYTLGHFPQSFELSTIGGWVASRSSGQQSLRYGRIEQLFAGGKMETLDGTLALPTIPASSAGPDLREIVLGSEGRMGIISEVTVRVSPLADQETFYVAFFPNWAMAQQFCQATVQQRIALSMLRVSNATETATQLKLAGHESAIAWLERLLSLRGAKNEKCMLTFGITGSKAQHAATKRQIKPLISQFKGVSTGTLLGKKWQAGRFRFPYLREALWEKGYVVDTLETATDWDNVVALQEAIESSLRNSLTDTPVHVFTHLSHVYSQGCSLYTTYLFPCAKSYQATLDQWKVLKHNASSTVVNNRGTISHQHGVGKDHAPYLPTEKGERGMAVLQSLCQHFDPQQHLNPDVLIMNNSQHSLEETTHSATPSPISADNATVHDT